MTEDSLNSQTITKKANLNKFRLPKLFIILAGVIILVIIGSLAYIGIQKASKLYKYSYSQMDSYTIPGAVTGSGMSFTKPVELTKLTNSTGQAELVHILGSDNNKGFVAYIAAASTSTAKTYTITQLLEFKTIFAATQTGYADAVSPIQQFIKDRLPNGWRINLDKPGTFFNRDISDNAWQFNFNASDPKNKKITFKGQVLYAIRGNNFYYFMVATTSDNWQINQKTWQQIFGSLQIGI